MAAGNCLPASGAFTLADAGLEHFDRVTLRYQNLAFDCIAQPGHRRHRLEHRLESPRPDQGSQWERVVISALRASALATSRSATGSAADERQLEPDPREQAALTEIRKLRSRGLSLRAIAAALNQAGHQTRRGTDWRLESVVRVLNQTRRAH